MTVIDVVNVRVDRELPVGPNPVAVAPSPTRNEVYVVNSGSRRKPGIRFGHQRREQFCRGQYPGTPAAGFDRRGCDRRPRLRGQCGFEHDLGSRPEGSARDCHDWRRGGADRSPAGAGRENGGRAQSPRKFGEPGRSGDTRGACLFHRLPGRCRRSGSAGLVEGLRSLLRRAPGDGDRAGPARCPPGRARPPRSHAGRGPLTGAPGAQARRRRGVRLQLAVGFDLRGGNDHQRCRRSLHHGRRPRPRAGLPRQFPALRGQPALAGSDDLFDRRWQARRGVFTWATARRRWHFPRLAICCSWWMRGRGMWRWRARRRANPVQTPGSIARCSPCCRRAADRMRLRSNRSGCRRGCGMMVPS